MRHRTLSRPKALVAVHARVSLDDEGDLQYRLRFFHTDRANNIAVHKPEVFPWHGFTLAGAPMDVATFDWVLATNGLPGYSEVVIEFPQQYDVYKGLATKPGVPPIRTIYGGFAFFDILAPTP